ncbi:MAG: hypothetical protein LC774_10705 [Acidobacteria bacterium]|nr:hypothetical protein [Acidobacteriota bacterium]
MNNHVRKTLHVLPRLAAASLLFSALSAPRRAAAQPQQTAQNLARRAAERDDRFVADAFSDRGNVRIEKLDVWGALADFDKAVACYRGNPDIYFRRAQARLINGDYAAALSDIDSGLALKPDDKLASIAYAVRGYVNVKRGDDAAARKDFDQSLKLNKEGKFFLHLHLLNLDSQHKELKRRRAAEDQRIS